MAKRLNDDLFEGTTMSFGQHLEELRVALFKSMFYLVIGALLGMLVANWVVRAIQSPLERSLKKFYVEKAKSALKEQYQNEVSSDINTFIANNKITPEVVYLEKSLLPRLVPDSPVKHDSTDDNVSTAANGSSADPKASREKRDTGESESTETVDAKSKPAVKDEPVGWWNSFWNYFGYGKSSAAPAIDSNLKDIVEEKLPPPDPHMVKIRIWRPLDIRIMALSAQEVFMIWVKASLIAGIVMASPFIFYQIWNFVAAGLYPHEKNYVYMYLPFSLGLFLAGAALAFFFVFDPVLEFLFNFNKQMGIDPDPRINEWLSFVLYLPLGFGVSFQLPLVILFLNRIGLVSIETYLSKWRIAILTIFVISMVLTPADPVSMLLMACPLTFLYFLGVGLCKWMPRGRNPFDEGYET